MVGTNATTDAVGLSNLHLFLAKEKEETVLARQ